MKKLVCASAAALAIAVALSMSMLPVSVPAKSISMSDLKIDGPALEGSRVTVDARANSILGLFVVLTDPRSRLHQLDLMRRIEHRGGVWDKEIRRQTGLLPNPFDVFDDPVDRDAEIELMERDLLLMIGWHKIGVLAAIDSLSPKSKRLLENCIAPCRVTAHGMVEKSLDGGVQLRLLSIASK